VVPGAYSVAEGAGGPLLPRVVAFGAFMAGSPVVRSLSGAGSRSGRLGRASRLVRPRWGLADGQLSGFGVP
jgi:hypothetical protein